MINCYIKPLLDYSNRFPYATNGYLITHLQKYAARMLSLRRKIDHITPVLRDLLWPPVEQRIEYKVLLLTYKAPAYLSELLSLYIHQTGDCSLEAKDLLTLPRYRLVGFGRRCFAKPTPSLWNPLSISLKRASSVDTFKSSLKTFLFKMAYNSIHWILFCTSILFVTLERI